MIRVGVLRGGPSEEFNISLRSGQDILDNFHDDFIVSDIFVDQNGTWFLDGLEISPQKASKRFDLFFNCLRGFYGEDGKVQQILDSFHVPYTGSRSVPSALAHNKFLMKRALVANGLRVPDHETISVSHDLHSELNHIFFHWFMPVVVKPPNGSSSFGVFVANTYQELGESVANAFNHSNEVMIEECIKGRVATCGILEGFRDEDLYAFLPAEVLGIENQEYICPGRFSKAESLEIQRLTKLSHEALGLRHYSRSDFVVSPKGIFILETNSLPALHNDSAYVKSLESVGSNLNEFSKHITTLALGKV